MQDLKKRFKRFAIQCAELIQQIPTNLINRTYSNQLIRSSSSTEANNRAALGKSTADFINKLKIVEDEIDESVYFLELLNHFNRDFQFKIEALLKEGDELTAIIQSIKTTRSRTRTS